MELKTRITTMWHDLAMLRRSRFTESAESSEMGTALLRQGAGGRGGEDGGLVLVLWGVKHGKLAHREQGFRLK